jgi:hypothetical protein
MSADILPKYRNDSDTLSWQIFLCLIYNKKGKAMSQAAVFAECPWFCCINHLSIVSYGRDDWAAEESFS